MPQKTQSALASHVDDNLHKAERYVGQLRQINTALVVTSLLSSGATTLFTGAVAVGGPVAGIGVGGWQAACLFAAGLGFVTTVCVGLNQQMQFADRLAKGLECIGRLKALDIAMVSGLRDDKELVAELESILRVYPEPLR
jgi:hypothetical protein